MTKKEALAKIEELKKYVEEQGQEPYFWAPKDGEPFFVIKSTGEVGQVKYVNDGCDSALVEFGNAFKTREAAERRAAQIEIENIEAQMADWDGKSEYYVLGYTDCGAHPAFGHNGYQNLRKFKSRESAQRCIDFIGQEAYAEAYGVKK